MPVNVLHVQQRQKLGQGILRDHLDTDASDPVNVDSQARQAAQNALQQGAGPGVFVDTQKQVSVGLGGFSFTCSHYFHEHNIHKCNQFLSAMFLK